MIYNIVMDKINRVLYKGIVACVVAVGIANVVDYFYAALHASAATSGSAKFKPSVVINPSATITLSNSSASLAVTPNKNGMFAYTQTPIRVDARTNTPNDVTVNMVPSGSANTLVSGSNSIATLDTTSCATGCATTSSNFLNRWGYNVTSSLSAPSTYLPVLTTTNQVLAYNNTAANISNSTATTRYVYFGMKVDQSTAPGTYSRALNFTVTVAPDPVPTMQDATSSSLAELMPNTGDTTTLEDERDGNTYTIAKLADGYYWMTQNLRLGKGDGTAINLSSSDSNLPSGTTFALEASGMGSNAPSSATGGDCNVGDWYSDGTSEYLDKSHLCINTDDTETYGVYYNWYTATAGTGTYSMTSGNATGSICPKGWILPPNSGERSYYNLLFTKAGLSSNSASSTTMQGAPYNFPLSGYTHGEGIDDVGRNGYFWSSSVLDNDIAYLLNFNSSRIFPQNYNVKGYGSSVRCVFGS